MQTTLPFFPTNTKLINSYVGFGSHSGIVYYFLYGNPFFCHKLNDRNGYRVAIGNLITNKLCSIKELSEALGEGRKNIERYAKAYREQGAGYFYERKERRGDCYKMTPEKLISIQSELDQGISIYRSALNHEISEAAISYHIKKGNLKKNLLT